LKETVSSYNAASLGEKDGDIVTQCLLLERTITRLLEIVYSAPFVRIQAKEIDNLIGVATTCQVILQHWTQLGNIGGRISNWNFSVSFGIPVGLHICRCGLDV
jgi:hypothetical protein